MKVTIDSQSGFCFGVVNAISRVESCLSSGVPLVSLGDIVHNGSEMSRLQSLGLRVAPEQAPMSSLVGQTVLIRAHGEPPSTYSAAARHGVTLIDATCPVVSRLQKTVSVAHAAMSLVGGQVVIFGRRGHAEVRGLTGQIPSSDASAPADILVVESAADLSTIDFSRPIYFLAQTTGSLAEFRRLGREIESRAAQTVTIHDTICRQVSGREEHLAVFARRFDVVVFVSGAKSSNGLVLFEAVRAANPRSYKIETPAGLQPVWFRGVSSVGVCGATSTPRWLMEQVAQSIAP